METRISNLKLKPSVERPRPKKTAEHSQKFNWFDLIYVCASVILASRLNLNAKTLFLPAGLNDPGIKMALAAAVLYLVGKQFTAIFLS